MKIIATVSALALLCGHATTAFTVAPGRMSRSAAAVRSVDRMTTSSLLSTAASASRNTSSSSKSESSLTPEFAAVQDSVIEKLKNSVDNDKLLDPLVHFVQEYFSANEKSFLAGNDFASAELAAKRILESIQFGMTYGMGPDKYTFGVTHEALRGKNTVEEDHTDFYKWGCDFFKPCMNLEESLVFGEENIKQAFEQVKNGENVVFFANHQSEADPQVFSLLLEKIGYGKEASEVTYVAGHKVTTDPLAIPFSMGRNLLCIHSKKHIDADPESKPIKQRQNMATMSAMLGMLKADEGVALWVAPSGGRDRRDVETGEVPIAPFDSKTIDMFRLMGNKSKKPTHYYPLSMVSYELCPPPDHTEAGVGEQRNIRFVPVGIACGPEVESVGGLEKRQMFCNAAQTECENGYKALLEKMEESK